MVRERRAPGDHDVDGEDLIVDVADSADVIDAGSGLRAGFAPGSLASDSYPDTPSHAGADQLFIKTCANTLADTGGDYVTVDILFTRVGASPMSGSRASTSP